ncbi:MAG: DUF2807 domain-containing protein [Bacteroidetes bacterium]|jgi:hypothetical protein|nr:DUF2807 domain-containing protein [Bacteroidota bacterium]MBT4398515.1 DUF2807 domain-containing protein [Bacteroidota bacterium]MBT4411661.1 DUF2807 domain-containing protein [Bacteroidota bacterium]MBT5426757.1 DUF2807 domain-containing protein [Bacteroidota bacterium]MBT7095315.1 DUF2807 domain-containing protein [Bacteroidota bacterium]
MQVVSESKSISGVTKVILREYGQLFISQGEVESLSIEGDESVTKMVRSEVRNNELHLDIDGGWWDRTWKAISSAIEGKPVKYHLTLKKLEGLHVSGAARVKSNGFKLDEFHLILKGAGEIVMSNIEANKLDVELPGAGLITISGNAKEQNVYLKGAGSYGASRLQTESTNLKLRGVGKATVWVTKSLDAMVDGVGAIEYYGNPEVRKSVNGLGTIRQRQ